MAPFIHSFTPNWKKYIIYNIKNLFKIVFKTFKHGVVLPRGEPDRDRASPVQPDIDYVRSPIQSACARSGQRLCSADGKRTRLACLVDRSRVRVPASLK